MKTVWTIVIIVVVLILLYVVYRYMFKDKTTAQPAVVIPKINIPHVHPISSTVINDVAINDNATKLMKMINCLGYQVQPIKEDGAVQAYTTNKTLDAFVKKFPKAEVIANVGGVITSNVIPITSNGIVYKVDKEKYLEFSSIGLQTISYGNKNESRIKELIDKMNSFWDSDYFNDCLGFVTPTSTSTEKVIQAIENSKEEIKVDCNSIAYKQKLTILAINAKQAESDWQVANYNLSKYNVQENREKEQRTKTKFDLAFDEYEKYNKLCKK